MAQVTIEIKGEYTGGSGKVGSVEWILSQKPYIKIGKVGTIASDVISAYAKNHGAFLILNGMRVFTALAMERASGDIDTINKGNKGYFIFRGFDDVQLDSDTWDFLTSLAAKARDEMIRQKEALPKIQPSEIEIKGSCSNRQSSKPIKHKQKDTGLLYS